MTAFAVSVIYRFEKKIEIILVYKFDDVSDPNEAELVSLAVTSSTVEPLFPPQLPFSKPVSAISNRARLAASF